MNHQQIIMSHNPKNSTVEIFMQVPVSSIWSATSFGLGRAAYKAIPCPFQLLCNLRITQNEMGKHGSKDVHLCKR